MFKVLIVDDEPAMRRGLFSKIDWHALGLTCAGEAGSGQEALDKLRALQPDIVLVDIRMPTMDGLALIECAAPQYPLIKWVIVSGFGDFDYAQRAIKFGVTDYLLKPVDDNELHERLKKLGELISEELREYTRSQFLEQQHNLFQASKREKVWNRLIDDKREFRNMEQLRQYMPNSMSDARHWAVAIVGIESFTLPHVSFRSDDDEPLVWFSLLNIVEEQIRLSGRQGIAFRHMHDTQHIVILIGMDNVALELIRERLAAVLAAIRNYLRLEASAAVSEPITRLTDAPIAYGQAASALKTKMLHGAGRIYDFTEIRDYDRHIGTFSLQGEDERLLNTYLSDGKETEIAAWLKERFRQLEQSETTTYRHVERLYIDMDSLFRKYLAQHLYEPDVIQDEQRNLIEFLTTLHNWRDVLVELQRKADFIMRLSRTRGHMSGFDIVAEVKQYIERSYQENITLSWVAERYYINPSYFSKLFKERCGENFNDYLTKVRFRHAVEFMKDPALKIGRIAELVGYKDATYFSSLFKKVHGITPMQYREQFQTS